MGVIIEGIIALFAIAMVFGIPLSFSPLGKAWAERIRAGTVPGNVEKRLRELESEVQQLREIVVLGEVSRRPDTKIAAPENQPAAQIEPIREAQ